MSGSTRNAPRLGGPTPEERELVDAVLVFASEPLPDTPGTVEARFRALQLVARAPLPWKSIDPMSIGISDPTGADAQQALIAFGKDRVALREALAALLAKAPNARVAAAEHIAEQARLREKLAQHFGIDVTLDGHSCRLMLGVPALSFAGGLRLQIEPAQWGVLSVVYFGLALLLDRRNGLARGLARCRRRLRSGVEVGCGGFFRRLGATRYCSPSCADAANRASALVRVRAFRMREPDANRRYKAQTRRIRGKRSATHRRRSGGARSPTPRNTI
jgi:hypothetical protein